MYKSDPLNVSKLIEIQKAFAKEYYNSLVSGINPNSIQINHKALEQVAPLSEWTLNIPREIENDPYPYEHEIIVDGVLFLAISAEPVKIPEPA